MKRTHRASAPHTPIPRKLAVLVAAALATGSVFAAAVPDGASAMEAWRKAPISFERNDGQFKPQVLFVARGVGGDISLRAGEIAIAPRPVRRGEGRKAEFVPSNSAPLKLTLAGAHPSPEVEAQEETATRSHYYGGDPTAYRENIPHYARVVMKDVYPSIDLALHGTQGALEYDFVVAPGANPRDIRLNLASAEQVFLDADGSLVMQVGGETLRQHAPVAFQQRGDERVPVAARFDLRQGEGGMEAGFTLGEYDAASPLVIDPLMTYSSFLGGSAGDFGGYVGTDTNGNIYLAHTVGPNNASINHSSSAVNVTKINPNTNALFYSTTLDGNSYDVVQAMAMGASGAGTSAMAAYITGYTASADYPRCAGCPAYAGGEDMFVTGLSPSGTMAWSRLMGGSGADSGNAIALDFVGDVYVAGDTNTLDFPATNQFGVVRGGFFTDAFVVRFGAGHGFETFSAFLGGSGHDTANGIAVDTSHNMYIVGTTENRLYPLVNAAQSEFNLGGNRQAFLTKVTADIASIVYSTFIGGSADNGVGVAIDSSNNAFVVGESANAFFSPWTSPRPFAGQRDVFFAKVNADGSAGTTASFLGGSGVDFAGGVAVGFGGTTYLTGTTFTGDFPVVDPLPGLGTKHGQSDAFVARFDGSTLGFSTFLGGSGDDAGLSIVLGSSGTFIGGRTLSADFPTVTPFRGSVSGSSDNFVSRIDFNAKPAAGDMNGDATSDIVITNSIDGTAYGWMMRDTTVFAGGYLLTASSGWKVVQKADFNGDGKSDLLIEHTDGSTYMWLMNGLAVTGGGYVIGAGTGWTVSHTGDFNGDGKADVLLKHTDGSIYIQLMNGPTALSGTYLQGAGSGWTVTHVADFNGDKKSDILLKHTDGSIYVDEMNGISVQNGTYLLGAGSGWSATETGDFNGDGMSDILITNASGGVYEWLMNGVNIATGAYLLSDGSGWKIAKTTDLDGDGRTDILIEHTDGSLYAWMMNGTTVTGGNYLLGAGTGWSVSHALRLKQYSFMPGNDLLIKHTDGSIYGWIMSGPSITTGNYLMGAGPWKVTP